MSTRKLAHAQLLLHLRVADLVNLILVYFGRGHPTIEEWEPLHVIDHISERPKAFHQIVQSYPFHMLSDVLPTSSRVVPNPEGVFALTNAAFHTCHGASIFVLWSQDGTYSLCLSKHQSNIQTVNIDSKEGVGRFYKNRFAWLDTRTREIKMYRIDEMDCCATRFLVDHEWTMQMPTLDIFDGMWMGSEVTLKSQYLYMQGLVWSGPRRHVPVSFRMKL